MSVDGAEQRGGAPGGGGPWGWAGLENRGSLVSGRPAPQAITQPAATENLAVREGRHVLPSPTLYHSQAQRARGDSTATTPTVPTPTSRDGAPSIPHFSQPQALLGSWGLARKGGGARGKAQAWVWTLLRHLQAVQPWASDFPSLKPRVFPATRENNNTSLYGVVSVHRGQERVQLRRASPPFPGTGRRQGSRMTPEASP